MRSRSARRGAEGERAERPIGPTGPTAAVMTAKNNMETLGAHPKYQKVPHTPRPWQAAPVAWEVFGILGVHGWLWQREASGSRRCSALSPPLQLKNGHYRRITWSEELDYNSSICTWCCR